MLPRVGSLELYFSFADGVFGYDCVECGAKCCRGHGWGGTERELVQLGKRYPMLPMFVSPRSDPAEPIHNLYSFKSGCFFLREDNRCGVEVDHGRVEKPFVCRAFPANKLRRAGDLLVAELHFLCPLRLARPGDRRVRHADVLADLELTPEVATQLQSTFEGKLTRELLTHEAWLRDRESDEDLLTRLAFADVAASRWRATPAAPSPTIIAAHRAYLVRLRAEIAKLLGVEQILPETPRTAPELVALLPRLRLALIAERPDDKEIDEVLPQLGRWLLAGSIYLELIAHLGSAVTVEVVEQALAPSRVFCELLSMADRVPQLSPGPSPDNDGYRLTLYRNQEAQLQRLLTFIHDENPRRRLTLRQIFDELEVGDHGVRAQLCRSFTREALARFRFETA